MKYLSRTLMALIVAFTLLQTPAISGERLMAHEDSTVTDTELMIMWASGDNGHDISFEDANKFASFAFPYSIPTEYDNWRIPYVSELKALYRLAKKDEKVQTDCGTTIRTPNLIQLSCGWIWAIRKETGQHVVFNFAYGSAFGQQSGDISGCRVLPVRDLL